MTEKEIVDRAEELCEPLFDDVDRMARKERRLLVNAIIGIFEGYLDGDNKQTN